MNSEYAKKFEAVSDDLDWLAFGYLMNELSDQQRVDFEDRLADDQLAQKALIRAVELTAGIHASCTEQVREVAATYVIDANFDEVNANSENSPLNRPAAKYSLTSSRVAAVTGIAAGIALLITGSFFYFTKPAEVPVVAKTFESEQQLAFNWASLMDFDSNDAIEALSSGFGFSDDFEIESEVDHSADSENESAWLYVAVQSTDESEEEDSDDFFDFDSF